MRAVLASISLILLPSLLLLVLACCVTRYKPGVSLHFLTVVDTHASHVQYRIAKKDL
jgi:hypothetical protein